MHAWTCIPQTYKHACIPYTYMQWCTQAHQYMLRRHHVCNCMYTQLTHAHCTMHALHMHTIHYTILITLLHMHVIHMHTVHIHSCTYIPCLHVYRRLTYRLGYHTLTQCSLACIPYTSTLVHDPGTLQHSALPSACTHTLYTVLCTPHTHIHTIHCTIPYTCMTIHASATLHSANCMYAYFTMHAHTHS